MTHKPDHGFDVFFAALLTVLLAGPTVTALWFQDALWLLLYIPVALIMGL